MPLQSDSCLCLRRFEYSETSQILSLFGRDFGLMRVIAKGAHRRTKAGASKFDGGVDLLDVGSAVFSINSEKDLGTLCEWTLTEGHQALRKDLRAIHLAQFAAELVESLLEEHDPHPRLFELVIRTLPELAGPRKEQAFLWFELQLLREAGYSPQFGSCSNCQRALSDQAYFSPAQSGAICRSCEAAVIDRVAIDGRLLRLAENVLRQKSEPDVFARLPRLTRHQTDPLNALLSQHVGHIVGKPMKLRNYVIHAKPG